jgi:23S rRNA (pseudouridine1915-N3)-methyltransferase
MNILILTEDRVKTPGIKEGIDYYRKLCSGWLTVTLKQVPNGWRSDKKSSKSLPSTTFSFLKSSDYLVALERISLGQTAWSPDSQEFAKFIEEIMQGAWHRLVFAVGGAEGLPSNVLTNANRIICLSHLTFPHDLVPLLLMEQIYRALTILNRHPYHR